MGWGGILGFEHGIIQAPLGPDISGPALVAAVANAGAIGHLRAPDWEQEVHRFAGTVPNAMTVGDLESMAMYAGQGIGLIKEILPAAEVVRGLVEGAQHLIEQRLNGLINKLNN